MQEEYRDYNKVVITLYCGEKSYIVSDVNKKGIPGDNCQCHLQSFSMDLSEVGTGNDAGTGSKGTLSLIDCNDAVLKFLMEGYQDHGGDGTFPKVIIEVDCFTGHKKWGGFVEDWSVTFGGTVPTIEFHWTVYPLNISASKPIEPVKFTDVGKLIEEVLNRYDDDKKMDFVFLNGGETYTNGQVSEQLEFPGGSLTLDSSKIMSNDGNEILSFYKYLTKNLRVKSNKKPICVAPYFIGNLIVKKDLSLDKGTFYTVPVGFDKVFDTEDTEAMKQLYFTFNSNAKAYDKNSNGCYVIPVDGYKCTLNNKDVHLNQRMVNSINGALISGSSGTGTVVDSATAETNAAEVADSRSALDFEFTCYNVACFECNNASAPVKLDVFNEHGVKRDYLCVTDALVKSVSYSLDGPVIKAVVTCSTKIGASKLDANTTDNKMKPEEDNKDGDNSEQNTEG